MTEVPRVKPYETKTNPPSLALKSYLGYFLTAKIISKKLKNYNEFVFYSTVNGQDLLQMKKLDLELKYL